MNLRLMGVFGAKGESEERQQSKSFHGKTITVLSVIVGGGGFCQADCHRNNPNRERGWVVEHEREKEK